MIKLPPAPAVHPHFCGNVQQDLSYLWDPVGVIQRARRKTLKYSAPDVNSQGPHWSHCGLSGLMECTMAASKFLNFCDLGQEEKTWRVPHIKKDARETLVEKYPFMETWFNNCSLALYTSHEDMSLFYFQVKSRLMNEWWWFLQTWVRKISQ